MSDSTSIETSQSGNFWQVILISLAAWILDAELVLFILGAALFDRNRGTWTLWGQITRQIASPMIIPVIVVLGLVWLPVAVIAVLRVRKKGLKASLQLVLRAFIGAPLIIGCILTIFIGLAG